MANEEQLRILKKEGVESWNKWRSIVDIEVDLGGANLKDGVYQRVLLWKANLSSANLSRADFAGSNFNAANLNAANLVDSILSGSLLQIANLSGANLSSADLIGTDLNGANLSSADLNGANLSSSILIEANFSEANLSETQLIGVQALGTNFINATLTGACIEDWNINSETNLENVVCDYIYLKSDKKERRPSEPNKNFEPGEFAKLVEKYIETVDLIFNYGIDWRAFFSSYQDLQVQYGEQNVSIQAIEKKSDGAFIIRLNVPPEANKADIESYAKQSYETKLQILKAKNSSLLRENANLNNIVYTLANRPIMNVDQRGSNIGIGHMSGGEIKDDAKVAGKMNVYASEQKQTLAEAAAEIQKLLKQLEQDNPNPTEAQQIEHINDETTPKFKRRVVAALKAAGDTAIDEFLDNSYVKVGKAAIMGWIEV